ncbi:unnamed protein product, partial [Amoebophrya sp. A120]
WSRKKELYARYVLLSVLVKLTKLVNGLCQLEWPQMWVGSSLGIGFDLKHVDHSRFDKDQRATTSTISRGTTSGSRSEDGLGTTAPFRSCNFSSATTRPAAMFRNHREDEDQQL